MSRTFPFAFIAAEHDSRHCRVVRVGTDGQIERSYRTRTLPLDLHLLADGSLCVSSNEEIIMLDAQMRPQWIYAPKEHPLFSSQVTAGGNVILGNTGTGYIEEITPHGTLVRAMAFPVAADCQPRYNMFRLIRLLENGRLLVACFHDNKLCEFDWQGQVRWQCELDGPPFHPLRLADGNTLVSLGPTGLIVELNLSGEEVWRFDMVADAGLERGWIAGLSTPGSARLVFSDSAHDRLVEIDRTTKQVCSVFQNRDILLHPSTHMILTS